MLPDKDFIATFGELYQMENGADYVLYCLILPIAASVAVLFVQMLLSMITAPVYGFFVVIFQVLLSFYFYSPFLPGNYQMFNRLALAREDGICAGQSFFICSIVIVSCIIIGAIYMKKRDIL